jgi:segregation and condensation protein B
MTDSKTLDELETLTPALAEEAAFQLAQDIRDEAETDELFAHHLAEPYESSEPIVAALETPVLESPALDIHELESCIEALLFVSDQPLSSARLRELLTPEFPTALFAEALTSLRARYQNIFHGIELVEVAGGLQFRTKQGRALLVKKLAKVQAHRLSRGAMESLAIIAYRQPILREQIDKIRGVDSSHFIRLLLEKKLIQIEGRSELPGRPILYSTTSEFLHIFGLKDRNALPSLHEIEQMIPTSESPNPEEEDPRIREMKKLVGQMKSDSTSLLKYDPKEDEKILKEMREKIQSIPTTTAFIEAQKALEKPQKCPEILTEASNSSIDLC